MDSPKASSEDLLAMVSKELRTPGEELCHPSEDVHAVERQRGRQDMRG